VPIKTQSRNFPNSEESRWTHLLNGAVSTTGVSVHSSHGDNFQTTTSFRSQSRKYVPGSGVEALEGKELKKALRAEYVRRYDTGNEFYTSRRWHEFDTLNCVMTNPTTPGARYEYRGYIYPSSELDAGVSYPDLSTFESSPTKIKSDGANAIRRTIPTAPEAGLAQFLGELKEQLPSLVGLHTLRNGLTPASAGNEYLNVEFGIKPFISDLEKLAQAVFTVNKLTRQIRFQRNSDQLVRRKITLYDDYTSNMRSNRSHFNAYMHSDGFINPISRYYSSIGATQVVELIHNRVTFSGAYTYHLAEGHSFFDKMERYEQLANHLLGTRITPSLVWELTPWSWLIDWFSDTGTFISNVSALSSDALVLRYGYIMHELHVQRVTTQVEMQPLPGVTAPTTCSHTEHFHSKRRTRATPYGFGIDLNALSAKRWAILSALGLTKSDKTMHYRI